MLNYIIETTILNGKFKGEDVLIPRIPMIPSDMPFKFKRLQFPINLASAIVKKQITRSIVANMWIEFRESVFFTQSIICFMLPCKKTK